MPRAQVPGAAQLVLPIENVPAAAPDADPAAAVKRNIIDRLYCEANMARRTDLYYISGLGLTVRELSPRLGSGLIRLAGRGDGYHLTPRSRDVLAALVTLYLRQGKHESKIGEYLPVETTLYELAVTAGIIENRRQWGSMVALHVSNCIRDLWSSGVEFWHEWATTGGNDTDKKDGKKRKHKKQTVVAIGGFHFIDAYRLVLYTQNNDGSITTIGDLEEGERGKIWLGLPIQDSIRRGLVIPISRRVISLLSRGPGTAPAKHLYYYIKSNHPLEQKGNRSRYELLLDKAAFALGIIEDARHQYRIPKRIAAAVQLLDEALREAGEGTCRGEIVPDAHGRKKLVITLETQ